MSTPSSWKRILILLVMSTLITGSLTPAKAHPGHERPVITKLKWMEPNLKSGETEWLTVVAHDPDSSISEVEVHWGDGQVSFAHTGCVQGEQPGEPATLRIPIQYEEPGEFVVEAVAYSQKKCDPTRMLRHSKVKQIEAHVNENESNVDDPDDAAGPLDVKSSASFQISDNNVDTTNLLAHRIAFFEDWNPNSLDSKNRLLINFQTNKGDSLDRRITFGESPSSGKLVAKMINLHKDRVEGKADIYRQTDRTIFVRFPRALLRPHRLRYFWQVKAKSEAADSCGQEAESQPCSDRTPDERLSRYEI